MQVQRTTVRVMPDGRVSASDAATTLGRSAKTLAHWRMRGIGPRSFKVNGRVFYDYEEVAAYR